MGWDIETLPLTVGGEESVWPSDGLVKALLAAAGPARKTTVPTAPIAAAASARALRFTPQPRRPG